MRTLAVVDMGELGLEPVRIAAQVSSGLGHEVIVLGIPDIGTIGYNMASGAGPGPGALTVPPLAMLPAPDDTLRVAIRDAADGAGINPRIVLEEGPLRRVVERVVAAAEPDLLVVPGVVPGGRLRSLLYGDPWREVVASSTVPVILGRPLPPSGSSILVVLEDPRASADAIRALRTLPLPPEARVIILGLLPPGLDRMRTRQRRRMVRRIDAARSMLRRAAIHASALVREQGTADEVLAVVRRTESAMVVVAVTSRDRRRRVTGLAGELMARCDASVMVVPTLASPRRHRAGLGTAAGTSVQPAGARETAR